MLTIGSLFSGIGGLELGLEWAGLGPTLWQVETDAKCRDVLARHWPEAERHEDVRTVRATTLAPVDLICGGFPCQDISSAGRKAGLVGARSGLWIEFSRIVAECRPRWVVVENVAGGARKWVDAVRRDLAGLGYACLPIPVAASDCGAPHERARIFVVAGTTADTHRQSGNVCPSPRRSLRDASRRHGWSAEPDVVRVVHGLPGRMDRQCMLGCAVVPQCAEVVGHVILRLMEDAP